MNKYQEAARLHRRLARNDAELGRWYRRRVIRRLAKLEAQPQEEKLKMCHARHVQCPTCEGWVGHCSCPSAQPEAETHEFRCEYSPLGHPPLEPLTACRVYEHPCVSCGKPYSSPAHQKGGRR